MGNTISHPGEAPYSSSDVDWAFTHPPLVLDVHNMPFLQAPEIEHQWDHEIDPIKHNQPKTRSIPAVLSSNHILVPSGSQNSDLKEFSAASPSNVSLASSSISAETQWKSVQIQRPVYHDTNAADSVPLVARASVTSQLSMLSNAKVPSPQRSHSLKIGEILKKRHQALPDMVDANIPPPVPPHCVFGESRSRSVPDAVTESALAAIESLELEVECDEPNYRERPRRRSVSLTRARSRSRSLSRKQSLSRSRSASTGSAPCSDFADDEEVTHVKSPTDIYTRKCRYPVTKSSHPSMDASSIPDLTKTDISDSESDGPHSPGPYFALDGYNEGNTTLRVINFASESQFLVDKLDYPEVATLEPSNEPLRQYRVKSKALIAMERELQARKRYARYGHTFQGSEQPYII